MTKNILKIFISIILFVLYSCAETESKTHEKEIKKMEGSNTKSNIDNSNLKYAYFASGCFWGTEYWFEKSDGIKSVVSGYAGGNKDNPTYQEVSTGRTGHLETVKVEYDPYIISYDELVKLFFETHNYSQSNGQGPDIGSQYLSAIFYLTDDEKSIANKYITILKSMNKKVATTVMPFINFWEAEEYHQDYYKKNNSTPYCHFYKKIF